jgi:plastocyanin
MPPEQPLNQPTAPMPGASSPAPMPTVSQPLAVAQPRPSRLRPLTFVAVLLVLLLVITAYAVATRKSTKLVTAAIPPIATVHITATGFEPSSVSIKSGTKVLWISDDKLNHKIASNPYPTDNTLPALKSSQLGIGAQYGYTFTTKGVVSYHDDLNPTLNGMVTVR